MSRAAYFVFALVVMAGAEDGDKRTEKRSIGHDLELGIGFDGHLGLESGFDLSGLSLASHYDSGSELGLGSTLGHVTTVTKNIAVPVPYPVKVHVPVNRPYPVPVPKPYPVHVPVKVAVPVPQPYPVYVPKPYPITVHKTVPIYIKSHGFKKYGW